MSAALLIDIDTRTEQLTKLLNRKGQIATIKTIRPMKMRKGHDPVFKESEFQCRIGVNYDNIGVVKEGRANGDLPAENSGLPWGTWLHFPYVIEHNDQYYIRCTSVDNNFYREPIYKQNGVVISDEDARIACLKSEFSKESNGSIVFNIKVDNIVDVK